MPRNCAGRRRARPMWHTARQGRPPLPSRQIASSSTGIGGLIARGDCGVFVALVTVGQHAGQQPVEDDAQAVDVGLSRRPDAGDRRSSGATYTRTVAQETSGPQSRRASPKPVMRGLPSSPIRMLLGREVAVDHELTAGVFERLGQDQHEKRRLSEIGQTRLAEPLRQASERRRIRSPRRSPGQYETRRSASGSARSPGA